VLFNRALDRIRTSLPVDWTHEDVAASIQLVSENVTKSFVGYWARKTGLRNVAVAGGVFANVRINEEVLGLDEIDNLFVHPGMADEGLFVGAALAMDDEQARRTGQQRRPRQLAHVYLGSDISEGECEQALRNESLSFERPSKMAQHVAGLLADGHVVARAAGRMEYGPRALGNRTIMYRPNDPSVNDWLNEMLDRTEFMPFAPAVLAESTDELFVNTQGGKDTARFMTITFHCKPWMKSHCAGVVHLDGTARPQLVRKEDAPEFYSIINEYYRLTGIPTVINTSFNIHEEPIVRTAQDAVRAFMDSGIDYLQLGPFVAKGLGVGASGASRIGLRRAVATPGKE
jgi:carbamoyltransferase